MDIQLETRSTPVTKEMLEVGEGLRGVMDAVEKATKDGWQPGTDLPVIIVEALPKLSAAIDNVKQASIEFKHEPAKAVMGALIPIAEGLDNLIVQKEEEEAKEEGNVEA